MTYVTSDLHAISLKRLISLLEKADFNDNDFLFILGDVIDRGDHSAELLQWIMLQPNVELLLGNHEAMMLSCSFIIDEITNDSISEIDEDKIGSLSNWMYNGGNHTLSSLKALKRTNPDAVNDIFDFISDLSLYETVTAGGRDYLLTHSGLGNFRKDKKISQYTADELLWNRPKLSDTYFDEITTIFGHTPTVSFGKEYNGRIIKTPTWIDIDTGVTMGNSPCLLRLDDMKEYYI